MFNYSSEVKWIRVTDIDGGLVWINLATVERIYQTSDGSTFECADTVTGTTVPFEKIPELLSGGRQMNETDEQQRCKYCHEPFLDFSGRTDYEVDLEDAAYCGTDDEGNLEFGAYFDSGCVGKSEAVNINYCPMCGRKLAEAQHDTRTD